MDIIDVFKSILDIGGMAGLAVFSMYWLNRVWQSRIEEEKAHSQQIEAVWKETRDVIRGNTEALTKICERLGQRE